VTDVCGEWVVDQAVQPHGGVRCLRGGATEVLADLAGRLLGYAAGTR
jgi:acyl-CoA dehydrogenase